jgi:small subunit ribosomal protein S2
MKHLPAALFFVDGIHERISISEAKILGIPTIGIVDSNTDPRNIDFPIPANDDSMKTIGLIVNYIADTIIEATGGTGETAPVDESMDSDIISSDKEETAIVGESVLEGSSEIEPTSDTETEPKEKLELTSEDEKVSEDVLEENQEK